MNIEIPAAIAALTPGTWCLFACSALIIGMSKTWIQGVCLLAIPLLAICFGARESTGVILPLLCFADLLGVASYNRATDWKCILRALPFALVGFALALAVDRLIPASMFRPLMGGCLAIILLVMIVSEFMDLSGNVNRRWWYGAFWGVLGGFTTMIGNAAGPVLAIYLLSMNMSKYRFVATSAWFFLVLNYLKLPIQVWAWGNITAETLLLDLCAVPFVVGGAVLGYWMVKVIPEKSFRYVTLGVTAVSVVLLFI